MTVPARLPIPGLLALFVLSLSLTLQAVTVDLVESSDRGLSLVLTLGELVVVPVAGEDGPTCLLRSEGAQFVQDAEGGWLCQVLEVGVPAGASVRWQETGRVEAARALPPPAAYSVEGEATAPRMDRPAVGLHLLDQGWVRGQRVQRLRVDLAMPEGSGDWRVLESLSGQLVFTESRGAQVAGDLASSRGWREAAPFDRLLAKRLLNGEAARSWRSDPAARAGSATGLAADEPWLDGDSVSRLMVAEDGLHRVTGAWLEDRGLPIDEIDPAALRLWNEGSETPLWMFDGHDGRFDREDSFVFLGRGRRGENFPVSFFTPRNPYFLDWSGGTGARVLETVVAAQEDRPDASEFDCELHLEESRFWDQLEDETRPPYESDHWFWRICLATGHPSTTALEFVAPDVAGNDTISTGRIRYNMRGKSVEGAGVADHHAIVRIGGQWAGDLVASGQNEVTSDWFPLAPGQLVSGGNTLEMTLPLDHGEASDLLYLNWIDLRYRREARLLDGQLQLPGSAFVGRNLMLAGLGEGDLFVLGADGRAYTRSERLPGGRARLALPDDAGEVFLAEAGFLLAPADLVTRENARLRDETNQADMLILAPAEYLPLLEDLATFHRQTKTVRLVDVESVYDEFNQGKMHSRAIKDFLRWTQLRWASPAPSYAMFVGKASRSNGMDLVYSSRYDTKVPSDWINTDPYGATATDEEFTYLVGEDTLWTNHAAGDFEIVPDRFQDIMVGRVSVNSTGQLEAFLEKHREYREHQVVGPWMEHQVLASDRDPDNVFEIGNQVLAEYVVPRSYPVSQLDVRSESPYYGTTLDFLDLFNDGCLVLNYNGHGSAGVYSSSVLFRATDIRFLTNRGKYPIGFAWSCLVGDYDNPDSSSMAELLIRKPQGGMIAFYGAAAKAYIQYDNPYMLNWFSNQYADEPYTFGEIVHLTESMMQATTGGRNVVQMYNLHGDPALEPALPRAKLLPSVPLLVAAGGETVQVTLSTDPPGLSGQLEVRYHANAREPINHLGRSIRDWTVPFVDGQTVSLDLPVDTQPRRAVLRFAMTVGTERATGSLPLYLNSSWAAAGGHEPERGRVGGALDFRLDTGVTPDSVELRTNYSLAWQRPDRQYSFNQPLQNLGGGVWTGRIDSLAAPWSGLYTSLSRDWIDGSAAESGDWPSFQTRGLLYRFRIWDEEEFVDANGNGRWDPGESWTDADGDGQWDPTGEPFVDANGNGLHDQGESWTDVNGNGVRDPWIDLPGRFVPIDSDEGLVALDTLLAIQGDADTLAARLRWQVAAFDEPDAAARRLDVRAPGAADWTTLVADTVAVDGGPQDFLERVALAPGRWETRFHAGPLFKDGERLDAVEELVLEDAFALLTPSGGSGGDLALGAGDWILRLPAGALDAPLQLRPSAVADPLALRMEGGQPGLGLARPAGGATAALRAGPTTTAEGEPGLEPELRALELPLPLDAEWAFSDGSPAVGRPALARWVSERGLWVVQPGATDSTETGWLLHAPLRLHDDPLWPVAVRDEEGPAVEISVSGQWFGAGDLVPLEPVFQIRLQDPDGLDLGEGFDPPRLWLDDEPVDATRVNAGTGAAETTLTWSPGLLATGSEHALKIEAGDALGNRRLAETSFVVGDRMGLEFFSNHPNPFADRTVFAWQLSGQPRSVRFEIYTAGGRLIRRLDVLAPRIGYDELAWDGTDRQGRPVANGVYFCRMRVDGDGDIDRVFKLARLQ